MTPEIDVSIQPAALIVDDNWYNRDIFRIALEASGFQIVQADNGVDGMEILKQRTFRLLVLDLQMPTVDGRTVLNFVRATPLHDAMRVIVVTANPHMVTGEIEKMADYIMNKPVNVLEFSRFANRLKTSAPI